MKAAVCREFGKPLTIEDVHLDSPQADFLLLEGIERWGGFHAEILKTPIQWQDGYVIPPATPGLGVELDEEVAARHPYEGDELHQVPVYGSAD